MSAAAVLHRHCVFLQCLPLRMKLIGSLHLQLFGPGFLHDHVFSSTSRVAARTARRRFLAVQGHTVESRIRVDRELRKTGEGKARLRAAAGRVGDAPTGRALKRVRFAENWDDDNAEMLEPTSESAPSKLPAEAASSSSAPTSYPRLQRKCLIKLWLSMKRLSDSSNSKSETMMLHTDHSTHVVMQTIRSFWRTCSNNCAVAQALAPTTSHCSVNQLKLNDQQLQANICHLCFNKRTRRNSSTNSFNEASSPRSKLTQRGAAWCKPRNDTLFKPQPAPKFHEVDYFCTV